MKRTIVFIFALAFLSCNAVNVKNVRLESTPLISKGIGWILVTVSWVRLKSDSSYASEDVGFTRRKDTFEVAGRAKKYKSPDAGVWFRVTSADASGWIHESSVKLYDSKERVLRAKEVLQ